MNLNFTPTQWANLAMFAVSSLAMAGWWQDMVTPQHAAVVSGALLWIGSILNFAMTGKVAAPAPLSAPTTPVA